MCDPFLTGCLLARTAVPWGGPGGAWPNVHGRAIRGAFCHKMRKSADHRPQSAPAATSLPTLDPPVQAALECARQKRSSKIRAFFAPTTRAAVNPVAYRFARGTKSPSGEEARAAGAKPRSG